VEAVQSRWPDGFIKLELDAGIDQYFRLQDELKATVKGT